MEELTEREQTVVETIDTIGWAVFQISPAEDDEMQRWFAYTAGLAVTHGWPELICFGLDAEVMGTMLNDAVAELKQKSRAPAQGDTLTEVLNTFPVRLETFPQEQYANHIGWALWFADYRAVDPDGVACLQIVWPDADGCFPSDPACDPYVREAQMPLMFEDEAEDEG